MKVSEKMAAVGQRRGREGKDGPPLGACAAFTCQKASWEMKSQIYFEKKNEKEGAERMLGGF